MANIISIYALSFFPKFMCQLRLCQQEGCCIHCDDLQEYYASIVNSLISASNIGVRQITLGVEKHWWTPELSDLKQQCIELIDIWRQHGCPRSGPIIENR